MKVLGDILKHISATRWIGTLFFVLSLHAAQAQTWPFELWHEGKIALASGDTLKGMIKYDLQQDLVQYMLQQDHKAEVFTARKVLFFEIFEVAIHRYRRFFALPFTTTNGYRSTLFFELLEEGKMTLLAREYLEYKSYTPNYGAYSGLAGTYSRPVLDYKYFFFKEDGTIEEFIGNKNDLLDMMGKRSEEVERYIKANHLRFDDKQDFTRIVDYYNSLFGG